MKLFGSFTHEKNGIAVRSPDLTRRGLIVGAAASLIAAPAIVRAASLMPVKAIAIDPLAASYAELKERLAANIFNMERLRDELLPGLREIAGSYEMIPGHWERVFAEVG